MTVRAELTVPARESSLGAPVADAGGSIVFGRVVPLGESESPHVWVDRTTDPYLAIDGSDSDGIQAVDCLHAAGTARLYRIDCDLPTDDLFATIRRNRVQLLEAVCTPEHWQLRLQATSSERLSAFRQECERRSITFRLDRLVEPTPPDRRPGGPTDRQYEALRLAVENGYYDIPRTASLRELGAELDVSHQAVSYRLRRGIKRLVEDAGTGVSDGEVMALASRPPG